MADVKKPQVVNHKEAVRVEFAANFRPDTFNEKENTIDMVIYSGAPVRRRDWATGQVYYQRLATEPENVRLDRINTVGVLLNSHKSDDLKYVLGRILPDSARLEDVEDQEFKSLIGTVKLSEEEVDAPIVNKITKGIIPGVSNGFDIYAEEVVEEGGPNGTELRVATDWEPFEGSGVALGADVGSQFLSKDNPKPPREDKTMAKENKPKEPTIQPDDKADNALALVDARKEGEEAGHMAGAAAEKLRLSEIQGTCDKLGLDEKFKQEWLDGEKPIEEFRSAAIDAKVDAQAKDEISTQQSVEVGETEDQKRGQAMADYMCHKSNPQRFPIEENKGAKEFQGRSLIGLARMCLESTGVNTNGMARNTIARRAMEMRAPNHAELQEFGFHTTSDFPLILANVAGKNLRQAYEAAPQTFRAFTSQRISSDLKTKREISLGNGGNLQLVLEGAEYQASTFTEGEETYILAKYGKLFLITEEAMINDDLGAFTTVFFKMGSKANTIESDVMWAVVTTNANMSDGNALFSGAHSNVTASAGGVPSVAQLNKGLVLMGLQTDPDGDQLSLMPKFIIVPLAQATVTQQLLTQITPATASNVTPEWVQQLTPIVEPRLDANSTLFWYLAADQNIIDTLIYAHLEGQVGPQLSSRNGFDVDGVEMKVKHYFAAAPIDHRGLYRNKGEA